MGSNFCDLMDYSPPEFSVHGVLQARILEWAAIPFSRGPTQGLNRGSLHCRQNLYSLNHQGGLWKDDAVKVLHSICQQIWKTQQWPQDWKRSVFIPIPKKGNAKACSNYRTTTLISPASKVMLKILQARLQQYMNRELQMFKLVLEKAEEPEIKLPTSAGSWNKQESSRKTSISALLTMP